jgi:hypothetical protein
MARIVRSGVPVNAVVERKTMSAAWANSSWYGSLPSQLCRSVEIVAASRGEGADRGFREAVVGVGAGRVVEGEAPAVGAHEVDRALGAGRLRDLGERDGVVAVQRADQVALGVGAQHVQVMGAQAQRAQAQGHEVAGLPGAGADAGVDHVAVGVRER